MPADDPPSQPASGLGVISGRVFEFLRHYQADVPQRWSAEDLAAQSQFVEPWLAGKRWLDWSTEASALALLQNRLVPALGSWDENSQAILLAGPIAELIDPQELIHAAGSAIETGGYFIGILPCLRDNSPESQLFAEISAQSLWPYFMAEEWMEVLSEASLEVEQGGFVPAPAFHRAVMQDCLQFKGFGEVFSKMSQQGYDPYEVGWGELRIAAKLSSK